MKAKIWLKENSFITDKGEHVISVTTFLNFLEEYVPDDKPLLDCIKDLDKYIQHLLDAPSNLYGSKSEYLFNDLAFYHKRAKKLIEEQLNYK